MKTKKANTMATSKRDPGNPAVAAVFQAYPKTVRSRLTALRHLIFATARATAGVGALEETLKWGQPSYLTTESGSGSTIRIDQVKSGPGQYALYFHCQTNLVATFRDMYPGELKFGGNRCILLEVAERIDENALRHCISLALTYHMRKSPRRTGAARRKSRREPS